MHHRTNFDTRCCWTPFQIAEFSSSNIKNNRALSLGCCKTCCGTKQPLVRADTRPVSPSWPNLTLLTSVLRPRDTFSPEPKHLLFPFQRKWPRSVFCTNAMSKRGWFREQLKLQDAKPVEHESSSSNNKTRQVLKQSNIKTIVEQAAANEQPVSVLVWVWGCETLVPEKIGQTAWPTDCDKGPCYRSLTTDCDVNCCKHSVDYRQQDILDSYILCSWITVVFGFWHIR